MRSLEGWSRLAGGYAPSFAKVVNGTHYRATRIKNGYSLAVYIEESRYWRFLGEYENLDAAKTRVNAIEDFMGCA